MKFCGKVEMAEGTSVQNFTVDRGSSYPETPNLGELFYHNTFGLCIYGTDWTPILHSTAFTGDLTGSGTDSVLLTLNTTGIAAGTYNQITVDTKGRAIAGTNVAPDVVALLGYTPVNKAGDNMTDSLSFPKTAGKGLLVEGAYGWRDLTGEIVPRATGTAAPTLKEFRSFIREYTYIAGDESDLRFHIPHDYVPNTDIFIHVHWAHNGTNITGNLQIDFRATYAKGHGQAAFPAPVVAPINVSGLNITNCPQYSHRVDEIQFSTAGGSSSQLDTSLLEVDGIILLNFIANTIPSISGSATANSAFIFTVDIHYQSTSMPTKNKSPSFYA